MKTNELYHYGVKGMKWGVRRYQNKDGTSTSLGKRRRQNLKDEASLLNRVKGPDDIDGWANLQKEIHKKSGNFYFGEGVSPEFKKAGSTIVVIRTPRLENGIPDFDVLKKNLDKVRE